MDRVTTGSDGSPTVVPAECIENLRPDFWSRRWTAATSFETEAVGVPRGMRQKSAVHAGGVERAEGGVSEADWDMVAGVEGGEKGDSSSGRNITTP